jgi:hypothetical protein
LKFSEYLISYPSGVFNKYGSLYKSLDISHGEFQFIIKISGHLNIDCLSTNKELLKEIVKDNFSNKLKIKEYRGTSL